MPPRVAIASKRKRDSQKRTKNSAREVKYSDHMVSKYVEALFALEAQTRRAETLRELQYLMVNESLKVLRARQILLFTGDHRRAGWTITRISSVVELDKNAPLIVWLQKEIQEKLNETFKDGDRHCSFDLSVSDEKVSYPFYKATYLPVTNRKGEALGAFCLMGEAKQDSSTLELALRLQDTYSHAWSALAPKQDWISCLMTRRNSIIAGLIAIGVLMIPVPLTVLAPAQIVASKPHIVTAPIDGVIEEIFVEPNTAVSSLTKLFAFNQLENDGKLAIAEREMAVAKAKFLRSSQSAFASQEGRRELAISKAEYEVAEVVHRFAAERKNLGTVKSAKSGIVIFSGKDDWEGRPVSIGEKIMRIADPEKVEVKIDLPVADAAILEQELTVRLFLDAKPLSPFEATIMSSGFAVERDAEGGLSFPIKAELTSSDTDARIGWRGTAQLSGQFVPLAYNLFRKPLSKIRQSIGW